MTGPLSQIILFASGGQADGLADRGFAVVPIENRDGAAFHAKHLGHFEQHRPDHVPQFETALQRIGDAEQQAQFIHDPAA
jgi:hypothetical protein